MSGSHLDRLLRETKDLDVLEALSARLSPTDLQSLLLEVYRRRAAKVTPAQLLERYKHDPFTKPSGADPRKMLRIDALAYEAAKEFEPIQLSPVCPLGSVSAVAGLSQDKTVTTSRNTEVVADNTNVMALECAARRAHDKATVRLCSSHRLLRPNPLTEPNSYQHFQVFALCTAGRDTGNYAFEMEALSSHLIVYLSLLESLQQAGYTFKATRVLLTDLAGHYQDRLQAQVIQPLATRFPAVTFGFDQERESSKRPPATANRQPPTAHEAQQGYYKEAALNILVTDQTNQEISIGDGGFTDWTRKLLQNQKERLMISGLGIERLCMVFGGGAR